MRRRTITLLLAAAVFTSLGCKSITSDHLIGQPLDAEEAKAYEGVWRFDDDVAYIKHTDGANLTVAEVKWDDDKFKLNQMHLVITRHGESLFVQMVPEEDGGEQGEAADGSEDASMDTDEERWLLIGLLSGSGRNALVLYGPNFERFDQAIKHGEVPGEADEDGNNIYIKGDKASLDAFIQPERLHELFRMNDPGVLTRIGGVN